MPIIISNSLILSSASADYGPNNPVIAWDNKVTLTTIVTDTEDVDFPAANLANPATNYLWKAGDDSEQYITVTLDGLAEADYMAVARHNWGTLGITVSVEADLGGSPQWEEVVQETVLPDDKPAVFRAEPANYLGMRFRLQVPSESPALIPQAAVVSCGKLLVLQRRIYVGHVPMPYGRVSTVVNGKGQSGTFLGRIVLQEFTQTGFDMQNITPEWYRTYMDPFIEASKEVPFFFAWRPSDYPYEVGYCWMTNEPQPANQRSNGMMEISLQMDGIV